MLPYNYKHSLGAFWTLVDQGVISLGAFLLNIQLAHHVGALNMGKMSKRVCVRLGIVHVAYYR
jgi:hypothetical protein